MNLKIKYRESFRPFAPSVLAEKKNLWFDLEKQSPYMLLVSQVRKNKLKNIKNEHQKLTGLKRINVGSNFNFNYKINKDELKINKKKYIKFEQYYLSNPNTNFRQINGWDTVSEIVAQD